MLQTRTLPISLQLPEGSPWTDAVNTVSLSERVAQGQEAPSLQVVPKTWDNIIHDRRVLPGKMKPG